MRAELSGARQVLSRAHRCASGRLEHRFDLRGGERASTDQADQPAVFVLVLRHVAKANRARFAIQAVASQHDATSVVARFRRNAGRGPVAPPLISCGLTRSRGVVCARGVTAAVTERYKQVAEKVLRGLATRRDELRCFGPCVLGRNEARAFEEMDGPSDLGAGAV